MTTVRMMLIASISTFVLGFGLGGISLHAASAQGLFGLKGSITQIGTALVEMQKNVDDLQKNMETIKQAKDQLSSLSPTREEGGTPLKELIPGMGQLGQ